jgi:hypothetical protein
MTMLPLGSGRLKRSGCDPMSAARPHTVALCRGPRRPPAAGQGVLRLTDARTHDLVQRLAVALSTLGAWCSATP